MKGKPSAAVWGRFIAPKAKTPVGDPWRLALELLVFGSAVAALLDAEVTVLAIVLGAAAALHLALTFPLKQRGVTPGR